MTAYQIPRDATKRERFDRLSVFYESHRREIMAYALYFTRNNEEDAYDALQETFCLAMENLNRNDDTIENPRAWLMRIARNVLLRKQDRARQEELLWKKKNESEPRTNNFTSHVLNGMLAESITEYIRGEFSQPLQEIFVLRHFHEMNLADIAEVTEMPLTSVHRLLGTITTQVQQRFSNSSGD